MLIFVAALVVFVLIVGSMGIRIIRPFERGLVERLGKFQRTMEPGLNLIMPFIDLVIKVDMREVVLDVPSQMVITKDNVNVEVDAIVYAQVTDPARSRYEISNYIMAATKLAQTNLRNVLGELDLDQCLSSRDVINSQLRDVLDSATDKWGVKVNRVELQRIDPPHDITEAMSRQMKAERDKRAQILEAEGIRQSDITKAEGEKQSAILIAQGDSEAVRVKADAEKYRQIAVAEGEAEAIADVFDAIHKGKPDKELIALKYLEMLPRLAENPANKIFIPIESAGTLGALSTLIEGVKSVSSAGADRGANSAPSA
ncbi:SPFH/Band 7/PHB domain protein [bacterium AH-315-F03]|nr:SPFH/Band 7/PHB domain protein [bacterium AH-315-F03]